MTEAFPLHWPDGWPRTHPNRRKNSLPGGGQEWLRVVRRLITEVQRIGGKSVVLSTNQPIRLDGMPYSARRNIEDPGAAIYFTRDDRQMVMAQDNYWMLVDNIRSLALAIEGLRQMERHGGAHMMERAFAGFEALPPPSQGWRSVLGLAGLDCSIPAVALAGAEAAYKTLARKAHPDAGGSSEKMSRLNVAIQEAREALQ